MGADGCFKRLGPTWEVLRSMGICPCKTLTSSHDPLIILTRDWCIASAFAATWKMSNRILCNSYVTFPLSLACSDLIYEVYGFKYLSGM